MNELKGLMLCLIGVFIFFTSMVCIVAWVKFLSSVLM